MSTITLGRVCSHCNIQQWTNPKDFYKRSYCIAGLAVYFNYFTNKYTECIHV